MNEERTAESPLSSELIFFNPFLPEVRANPYPHYRELREREPLHRNPLGFWIISRYREGASVLRDRRFAMIDPRDRDDPLGLLLDRDSLAIIQDAMTRTMLFMNPPDHTRIRSLVTKAFTSRVVEGLRPRIQAIVDELIDAVAARGEMDLVADVAYPLPVTVIAEMMGIPAKDRFQFRQWATDLAPTIDPVLMPDALARAVRAVTEFAEYFRPLVEDRRRRPQNDLLSALIAAEEAGDRLSEEELFANAILLIGAGHETTTNLIGNGLLALLRNPAELERLRRSPELVEAAVEELLRYDSPVQMSGRKAKEDLMVGDEKIAAGERVLVLIGAVNRDPERFTDPDRLDVARSDNEHLTFGGGVHYCLGASLARAEGQIAIATLLRRLDGLELASEAPEWRETITLRGVKSLPLRFRA
jgi:cytochrome P450